MSKTTDLLIDLLKVYTQAELERMTGIRQWKLSRWAAGKSPPAADDALKLAELRGRMKPRKDAK